MNDNASKTGQNPVSEKGGHPFRMPSMEAALAYLISRKTPTNPQADNLA